MTRPKKGLLDKTQADNAINAIAKIRKSNLEAPPIPFLIDKTKIKNVLIIAIKAT